MWSMCLGSEEWSIFQKHFCFWQILNGPGGAGLLPSCRGNGFQPKEVTRAKADMNLVGPLNMARVEE